MDVYTKEIHAVGSQMVHLICDRIDDSPEFRALIEGGGVCIAKAFPTAFEADVWLHELFFRMFRGHQCDLGCIRVQGAEFLADQSRLEHLTGLPDLHLR